MEDWRVLVNKEWISRGGERGEEQSLFPRVKSGGLENMIGQIGAIRALSGGSYSTDSSRGEKWWVEG